MTNTRAEIWRNGKLVAHCHVCKDSSGAYYVSGTDEQIPDGDYEIRNGDAVEEVTFKDGTCGPRVVKSKP